LYPLWHGFEDQWACIPNGKTLVEDQWACIPYGTTWLKTVGLASLTGIFVVFNSIHVFYWVHYRVCFYGFPIVVFIIVCITDLKALSLDVNRCSNCPELEMLGSLYS
jgi:hypothetical protein